MGIFIPERHLLMLRGHAAAAGLILAAFFSFHSLQSAAGRSALPLSFGVFPRWNAQIMVRDFTPLAHVLGQALGREVRVETDKDFDSFMHRVNAGEFDIVYLNHLQYVQAHKAAGYVALVKLCESSECTITAAIIVRGDSGFNKVTDLRGKTIAFGDRNAMVSHILASTTLRVAGLEPDQYHAIFTKNPPNALFAVYNHAAHAAGVGPQVFSKPEVRQLVDLKKLKVLAESQPIPQLPLAVRGDMNPQLAKQIQMILLNLPRVPAGAAWLKQVNAERFDAANDAEYQMVTQLLDVMSDAGH